MGAGASVVLNNLLDALNNDKSATEEEKQARLNLIGSLIAGITSATGGDAGAASNAAQIETANNHLSDHEMRTLARELQGCEQRKDCTSIAQTYMDKHLANKETFEKVCEVSMDACKIMASEMYDAIYKFQTLGYYSELEGQAADILLAFQQMNLQAKQDASGTITLPTAEAMVEAMGFNPKDEKARAIILTIAAVVAGKAAGGGRGIVPRGFANTDDFAKFGSDVRGGLSRAGYGDVEPILQGSAVTGKSFRTGQEFDVGRVSDFDIALASPELLKRAQSLGVGLRGSGTRTRPLSARDLKILGLSDLANELSAQVGREVNFMIYGSSTAATSRAPSIVLPR